MSEKPDFGGEMPTISRRSIIVGAVGIGSVGVAHGTATAAEAGGASLEGWLARTSGATLVDESAPSVWDEVPGADS
jgi:hypothetical protein